MEENRRITFTVHGMTCEHCEARIRTAVSALPGVHSVEASHARRKVTVTMDPALFNQAEIAAAIHNEGYQVVGSPSAAEPGSSTAHSRLQGILTSLATGAVGIVIFLILNHFGVFSFLPSVDSSTSLFMVFVAGLLTSVHCIAMCGGIALSVQTGHRPKARGLAYHGGRVVSYTIIGAIVGGIGSVLSLGPGPKAAITGIAALGMLFFGLRGLGLLPFLSPRAPRLHKAGPLKDLHKIAASLRSRGPFAVGLLNGLMPCGPLQTMQLYALGTGSALIGGLSMFIFSLGTIPLMFGFGALASLFSPRVKARMVQASAVLVVFFGVVMAGRALDMSGISASLRNLAAPAALAAQPLPAQAIKPLAQPSATPAAAPVSPTAADGSALATVEGKVQTVRIQLSPRAYQPITVQKGIPVRWIISATARSINGCNNEIVIPDLGITKKLKPGDNIIEFTPASTGTIGFTCWMGMISSWIRVVPAL